MSLSVGIVGLPNVGPEQNLPQSVLYVHAPEERLYGAQLGFVFKNSLSQKGVK